MIKNFYLIHDKNKEYGESINEETRNKDK